MRMNGISALVPVLLAVVLPIAAAVVCALRIRGGWKLVLYGCLTFLMFQGLIRIPLLQLVLPQMDWYLYLGTARPLLLALLLAGSAALFEEGGRYLVMRLLIPSRTAPRDALAFGVGHGGVEALLLTGINAVIMLFFAAPTAPALLLAAGVERLFAMVFHVAASLMVAASVREQKPLLLLIAFTLHTLLNLAATLAVMFGLSLLLTEAVIGVFALSLTPYIVYALRRPGPDGGAEGTDDYL